MLGHFRSYWHSAKRQKTAAGPVPNRPPDGPALDQIADMISRYGLRLPALLVLEMGHPLTFLGGQLMLIGMPALALFVPAKKIRRIASLLEDQDAMSALVARLEATET